MSETGPAADDYRLVPAATIDDHKLLAFDVVVRHNRYPPDRILSSWWRRAGPDGALAVIHVPSGAMVGICGARPSTWMFDGQPVPTVAICEWFVDGRHAGKGLGKRMVQHFNARERFLYTFVISGAAIANFQRLGWVGPYVAPMLAHPAPRLMRWLGQGTQAGGIELADFVITDAIPAPLAAALDRIETTRGTSELAHMHRGAQELAWRLSVSVPRERRFSVAQRGGTPIGYVAVRRTTPGTNRLMDRLRAAIVTDLVALEDDDAALRALARRAALLAGELGAFAVLATSTVPAQQRALRAAGFLSPDVPLLGRFLKLRSPRFMWVPEGPGATLTADRLALTFADSDADLNL